MIYENINKTNQNASIYFTAFVGIIVLSISFFFFTEINTISTTLNTFLLSLAVCGCLYTLTGMFKKEISNYIYIDEHLILWSDSCNLQRENTSELKQIEIVNTGETQNVYLQKLDGKVIKIESFYFDSLINFETLIKTSKLGNLLKN